MVNAVVSSVIGKLESIAGELAGQEFLLWFGVKKEAEKLKTTLLMIEAVLQDAEVKQVHQRAVKVWMQTLKHIMYETDNVLDDWFIGGSISQSALPQRTGNGITNKVFSCLLSLCSCFQPVFVLIFGVNFRSIDVHFNIAHKMKDIRDRLDSLNRDKNQLDLIPNQREEGSHHLDLERMTISTVDMTGIFGREFDKETIVSRLQGESSKQEDQVPVPIISIVGLGGMGKTTLAQIIYKEDTINTPFELRMWVCVSEPFDLKRVAKEILQLAKGDANIQDLGLEALHQRLRRCVQGRRFLLVLDDVWSEDPNDWNPLKLSLDAGERGSRIIITTRSEQVANMVGSTYIHKLGQLSDDDSCSLFWKIASIGRSREELQAFEGIGVNIARKCKGLPLAIKTIASLMQANRTKEEWSNVLVNGIWDVKLIERKMLPALLLSYYALPPYLKQCFTYCAIFPKDSVIKKNELVQLWMAQGYLGLDEERELEMIGVDYFKDLAMRSFFQDFQFDDKRNIVSCKMHDLVHDLAHFLTETECLVLESNDIKLTSNDFRHIHAYRGNSPDVQNSKNLHTLIIRPFFRPALAELCSQLRYLRVLSLDDARLEGVPDEVGRLIHLRFLDLSRNYALKELPEAMCNLTNLQTLKLNGCLHLCKLPEGIGKLSKLRHLEIEMTTDLSYFPQSIGKLSRLRTLCTFIVGGGSNECSIGELRSLNHLGGTLKLFGLMNVQNVEAANQAKLKKKSRLSCLWLYFADETPYDNDISDGGDGGGEVAQKMEGVLQVLEPNANLEELLINGYPGVTFPIWMSGKLLLSNIVNLMLRGCDNCIQLPALGNLVSLESLSIDDFKALKHIGREFYGVETSFPNLKELTLVRMRRWEDWEIPFSNFSSVMPRLIKLEVRHCPKLMGLPALGRLESLETLKLVRLDAVETVGAEFLGISSKESENEKHQQEQPVFPRLKELTFLDMLEWEEWDFPIMLYQQKVPKIEIMPQLSRLEIDGCPKLKAVPAGLGKLQSLESLQLGYLHSVNSMTEWEARGTSTVATAASIMPGLKYLRIREFTNLKVLPHHMLSHSLRKLWIIECPALTGSQPCLPPLLEGLVLDGDVGILSKSLIHITAKDNTYPNLTSLTIENSPHSSLPDGLSKFTSLQLLKINSCMYLDFKPELIHFPILQELEISYSRILRERCIKEDWKNKLSHQISYNIVTDRERIIGTKRHQPART